MPPRTLYVFRGIVIRAEKLERFSEIPATEKSIAAAHGGLEQHAAFINVKTKRRSRHMRGFIASVTKQNIRCGVRRLV